MAKFDRSIISSAEMEWHFNPRVTVPDRTAYMTHRNYANDRVIKKLTRIPDLRYGPNPGELLDIYPGKSDAAPVLVYIHGGYWRAGYKEDWAFVAEPLVDCGATVVVLNYDLCPTISLDELVSEIRRAMTWIFHNIREHGGNPHQMFISGSSAGAHLCAMMLGQKWREDGLPRELIRGAVLITGIYDVLPVLDISVNKDIRLDPLAAERNSPMRLPPQMSGPLLAAFGANEAEGWKQQTRDYIAMCQTNNIKCDLLEMPDHDHFSLGTVLGDSDNPLVRTILGQMGLL